MTEQALIECPLLTVAIPTYNRASYLERNLSQLRAELIGIPTRLVEVIVSDNCSPDSTPQVVERAIEGGVPITYLRNATNVGWARNFVQCFDLAQGKYVLMLGDDDVFVDGALGLLLRKLAAGDYGVVVLRPYGYDRDVKGEFPGGRGRDREFSDSGDFLVAIARFMTLTSACVINKSLLPGVDSAEDVTGNLATFHLLLKAALAARQNLFVDRYLLASKRQNSVGYEFADVFVREFWRTIDRHANYGLSQPAIRRLERDRMFSYYPFYLFDMRASGRGDLKLTYDLLASRFHGRWLFTCWIAPIVLLPRPMAMIWGAVTTAVGRVAGGELRRGLRFAWNRVMRRSLPPARELQADTLAQ